MDVFMDIEHLRSLDQLESFVKGSQKFVMKAKTIEDKYEIIKKLKEISEEQDRNFLNKDISFEDLDKIAYNMSDNDFAVLMRKQQNELFDINSLLKSQ